MARLPTERDYVTGSVPPEMLGTEADPAADTSDNIEVVNEPGLTRVRIPTPAQMPSVASLPALQQSPVTAFTGMPLLPLPVPTGLTYDFALLPDVQCHLVLQGPANADHLEQLVDYLTVAVKRLRVQEERRLEPKRRKEPKE